MLYHIDSAAPRIYDTLETRCDAHRAPLTIYIHNSKQEILYIYAVYIYMYMYTAEACIYTLLVTDQRNFVNRKHGDAWKEEIRNIRIKVRYYTTRKITIRCLLGNTIIDMWQDIIDACRLVSTNIHRQG